MITLTNFFLLDWVCSIDLNFDKEGRVKNDFKINGIVKNLKIKTLKNYNLDNLNFIFNAENNMYKFLKIDTLFNKIIYEEVFVCFFIYLPPNLRRDHQC